MEEVNSKLGNSEELTEDTELNLDLEKMYKFVRWILKGKAIPGNDRSLSKTTMGKKV